MLQYLNPPAPIRSLKETLSRHEQLHAPETTRLIIFQKHPFLQAAGYDFNFGDWPQLLATAQKAQSDSKALEILFHFIKTRLTQLRTAESADPALADVAERFSGLALKLPPYVDALHRTKIKAHRQALELLDRGSRAGGTVHQAESLFLPGKRVTFTGGGEAASTLLKDFMSLIPLV